MKRPTILLSIAAIAALSLLPMRAFAASATISLMPSMSSATTGDTVTITVTEDSGSEPVNAVQANLNYPTATLQYVSVSNNDTFKIDAQTSAGSGTIALARGTFTPVTGPQPVAVLTFKVLSGSGTADLSFTSGTSVVSSTSNMNILGNMVGTSVSLNSPASTDNSTGSGDNTANDSSHSSSCSVSCDTQSDTSTAQDTQQQTTTLVNTGTDLLSVLGISGLATAVSYVAALSYRKITQR